jgi:chaperonin GroEL (HSP60 family)
MASADDAKFALDNAKRAYDDALKAARAAKREAIGLGG